jgi:hypothetical protein
MNLLVSWFCLDARDIDTENEVPARGRLGTVGRGGNLTGWFCNGDALCKLAKIRKEGYASVKRLSCGGKKCLVPGKSPDSNQVSSAVYSCWINMSRMAFTVPGAWPSLRLLTSTYARRRSSTACLTSRTLDSRMSERGRTSLSYGS